MAGPRSTDCSDFSEELLLLESGLADLRKAKKRQTPSSGTACGSHGEADLLLLEAGLEEDFGKVTKRGKFRDPPSRKKRAEAHTLHYEYGSCGRACSNPPRPPRKKNVEKENRRNDHDDADPELQQPLHAAIEGCGEYSRTSTDESVTAIDSALDELRDILKNVESSGTSSTSVWQDRMERREEAWEVHRPPIYEKLMSNSYMPRNAKCQFCEKEAMLRCLDCGPWYLLCSSCDCTIHSGSPFHDREAWLNGCFHVISPRETVDSQGAITQQERCLLLNEPEQCPLCGAQDGFDVQPAERTRLIVTLKGCYELNDALLVCQNCKGTLEDSAHPLDAIDRGFWPGSTQLRSKYLFDLRLFEFYNLLQMYCPGLSESGFLKCLTMYSQKSGRGGAVNPATFSKAFDEWRYFNFETQRMQQCCGTECPCCHINQHSVHVDGNKKLYRYAKVPRGTRSQYFQGTFIASNASVERHLELVGYRDETSSQYGVCGTTRWKAAKAASKSMANLDETGLEVAGCRHGIAQKAVNMFRGEIFGYPHYLHKVYFTAVTCFWADVICQYWPWALGKEALTGSSLMSIPCLSVMHANAHSWPCQVLWGGRWQAEAAASTGEDMEQLFSFLSRFNATTKNMSAAGREEQLTCAALFWNSCKIEHLAKMLHLKLLKVQKQKTEHSIHLVEVTKAASCETAKELGRRGRDMVQKCAKEELTGGSVTCLTEMAEYFRLKNYITDAEKVQMYLSSTSEALSIITGFHELFVAAKNVVDDLPTKKARLASLETKVADWDIGDLDRESLETAANNTLCKLQEQIEMGYLHIQRKHCAIQAKATSSKQRASLRRAITTEKKKVANSIHQYNSVVQDVGLEIPLLSDEEVFDGKFPWSPLSTRHSMSMREAYNNAMSYNRLMRTEEEEVLLIREMCSYISFYQSTLSTLRSKVQSIDEILDGSASMGTHSEPSENLTKYQRRHVVEHSVLLGERAVLTLGIHRAQALLTKGAELFYPFLEPGTISCSLQDPADQNSLEMCDDCSSVGDACTNTDLSDAEL